MTRVDLFGVIHKGIRALLFELSSEVARLDVTSTCAVDGAAARIEHVLGLVAEHAAHEDTHVFAAVRAARPALADELAAEHAQLDELTAAVVAATEALALAQLVERVATGARLQRAIDRLVAGHLLHMIREETEANAALWAAFDDAALVAIRARIEASIPGPRMSEWRRVIAGAVNPVERRLVVEGGVE